MNMGTLPRIIVTGASGFVGRHFIEATKEHFRIFAFARRSQQEVGVERHPNIKWILVDVAEKEQVDSVFMDIRKDGGADFILHLAAYFDFGNEPHPEYERTNIQGLRNILEACRRLAVQRFIFASSLVVTEFPPPGEVLTEQSPGNATFPYADTKIRGEAMLREYEQMYPISVVRFAAVFSDWCEYGPLYKFLDTWFSRSYMARILAGEGRSAVPYIHVTCLTRLLLRIIRKSTTLPNFDVYLASPDQSTSHRELFQQATRLFFGESRKPFLMPKGIARFGVYMRDMLGKLIGRRPFERPWMLKYVDEQMDVDASYTREELGWNITSRFSLSRRLLYMIEHMKTFPAEWHQKNAWALYKSIERPDLKIVDALNSMQEDILSRLHGYILLPAHRDQFPNYQSKLEPDKLRWYLGIVYNQLKGAVRTGDRLSMANYARFIASIRIREGFTFTEVREVFAKLADLIVGELLWKEDLKGMENSVRDAINLPIQMAIDEIEDAFESVEPEVPYQRWEDLPLAFRRPMDRNTPLNPPQE